LAICGDAENDQPRIEFEQRRDGQAPAVQSSRPEILNDDIDLRRQTPKDFLAFTVMEVEGHRALVTADHLPE